MITTTSGERIEFRLENKRIQKFCNGSLELHNVNNLYVWNTGKFKDCLGGYYFDIQAHPGVIKKLRWLFDKSENNLVIREDKVT
eukprot:UN07245